MRGIKPSLDLLAVSAELVDDRQVERLAPLHRAFARLDYPDRRWVLAHVRRLQEAVPGLDEADCLAILAEIGLVLNGQDNKYYLGLESVSK